MGPREKKGQKQKQSEECTEFLGTFAVFVEKIGRMNLFTKDFWPIAG